MILNISFKSTLRNRTKDIDILIMLGGGNNCLNFYEKYLTNLKIIIYQI